MPHMLFAPDVIFAWVYLLALVGLMVTASWFDLRRLVIPKQLALATLILGVLANLIRGFWLGSLDLPAWQLGSNGPWIGALDGLLFSLAGFAAGFGIFLFMWLLGTAGGGDVKQFAAVCAWVGPLWTIYLLIGTIIAVAILSGLLIAWRVLTGGMASVTFRSKAQVAGKDGGKLKLARGRRLGWSVPATVGLVVVLLWVLRYDLHLQAPKTQSPETTPATARR
jgi:Flp pilus assembly protein protease CpaA